jgi:hypothetical protein
MIWDRASLPLKLSLDPVGVTVLGSARPGMLIQAGGISLAAIFQTARLGIIHKRTIARLGIIHKRTMAR